MGSSPYGTGTNCIRWLFVICNCIFAVLGAVALGIGIWGVVVGSDYDAITGNETVSGAALLLVGGVITLAIAGVGIIGACAMWRPLLIIYAIALIVIFILELASAILAFVFQDNVRDTVRDNMEEAIGDYRVDEDAEDFDSDVNDAVEFVQDRLECCGVDNYTDWFELNARAVRRNSGVPPGDCSCDLSDDGCETFTRNGTTFNVWEDGCLSLLEDNVRAVLIATGVVGIIFAVIEIGLALVAIGLCCCIYSTHRQSVV